MATADAFVTLKARRPRITLPPGCLPVLGGPLLALGLWLIAVAVVVRPEAAGSRSQIIAGIVIAIAGLLMLLARMRRTLNVLVPVPDIALERGHKLCPGAVVPLRIRLRATTRLSRLKVALVCERRYSEQVMAPGTGSLSTVDRVETLSADVLLDETNLTLNRRIPWERTVSLAVPYLGKPSGPVLPAGMAAWHVDVLVEPGHGKPIHDEYDLLVGPEDAADAAFQPAVTTAGHTGPAGRFALERVGPGVGCAVISLGFMFVGPIFLWFYFSGVPTRRGNPVMGLVAGILFTGLGLLGLLSLLGGRGKRSRKKRPKGAARLP